MRSLALLTAPAVAAAAGCTQRYHNQASSAITLCMRVNGGKPGEKQHKTLQPGDVWDTPCPSNANSTSNQMYFTKRGATDCAFDDGCDEHTGTCKSYPWVFGQGTGDTGLWYGSIGANWDGATAKHGPIGFTGNFGADDVHYGIKFACSSYNGTQHPDLNCTVIEGEAICSPSHPNQGEPSSGVVECDPALLTLTIVDSSCETDTYCCPDAKHCLKPTQIPCGHDPSVCAAGDVCCPITSLCVKPQAPCTPPPVCSTSEYCCPDAKHCLTPVRTPICKSLATCGAKDDECSKATHECVLSSGDCKDECSKLTSPGYCAADLGHCVQPTSTPCAAGCSGDTRCDNTTMLCVAVNGQTCNATCASGQYCAAGTCQHASGSLNVVQCDTAKDCSSGKVCCPLTKLCVSVGVPCTP